MDYTAFKKNVQALMDARGLTIRAFSEHIGVSAATISRYLTDEREPALSSIMKISESFGVSIDWLLGFNEDKTDGMLGEAKELVRLYELAEPTDRQIVQLLLKKYK